MAFDGVPIGICERLPQESRLPGGLPLSAGCPELEPPSGVVEMFPLPGHRHHLNAAASLPEPFPKLPVGFPPVIQLASGSHAWVDVDEGGPVRLNSHRQPEGEILDPPPGAAGIDPAGQQFRSDPELLEAGDLLLLGPQLGHLRMIEHDIKRKQAPPGDFRWSLPAVTQVRNLQLPVDLSGEKVADVPTALVEVTGNGPTGKSGVEQPSDEAGGCGLAGSEESLNLVAGEQARVQADQGDPLGLSRGEANRFQPSFSSLQVGNQGFPGSWAWGLLAPSFKLAEGF